MTGSEMGKLIGAILIVPAFVAAGICSIIALVLPPPFNYFFYFVATLAGLLALYLAFAALWVKYSVAKREAQDKAAFAAAHPELYAALLELDSICATVPGFKCIRFNTPTSISVNGGADIAVYAFADKWESNDGLKTAASIQGMSVTEWTALFPTEIGNFKIEVDFVPSPISLGWVGGLTAGIWRPSAAQKK